MTQPKLIRSLCHIFRHEWDGCRCAFCGKEAHDFRNACNRTPIDAYRTEGVFTCTRCKAAFHRVMLPYTVPDACLQCRGKKCIEENISYCSGHELTDTYVCPYYEREPAEWIEEWIVLPGSTERQAYQKYRL